MSTSNPKNMNELIDRLLLLENENKQLKKRMRTLQLMNDNARQRTVSLLTQSTKKSSFTNYEVKQSARDILTMLEKPPLLK